MKQAALLIFISCIYLLLYATPSQGTMVYPSKLKEQSLLNAWKKSTEFFDGPDMEAKRKEQIVWSGDFQEKEKEEILSFIASQSEFSFPGRVLKTDMNGDGTPDYVLWSMYIKNPEPYYYGGGYGVLFREKSKFKLRVIAISTERQMMGVKGIMPVVVDLNGDGFKEIISGWTPEVDFDPGYPEAYNCRNIVFKNEGDSFRQVYERASHEYLKVVDLDGNGIPEVLETINEYGPKTDSYQPRWQWVNVYNLTPSGLVRTNERYLEFYKKKRVEYEAMLKEAKEMGEEFSKRKDLCPTCTGFQVDLEKALQIYIKRIDDMIQAGSKGK